MMKRIVSLFFAFCILAARVATAASSTTPEFRLSLKADGIRASAGEETLRYSPIWDGGSNETAKVTLKQGDAVLSENLTAEGDYAWSVSANGTYNLTHATYTNGAVAKVLNATFVVTGKDIPFPPGSVTATGYSGKYDGNGHGITVKTTDVENPSITYARTEAGPYTAVNPLFTNVCNETVWYVVAAPGYIAETNSATVVITSGDIGGGGGEEPGPGEIPEGGLSKYDATYLYDGEGHTIKTQALFAVTLPGAVPSFSFAKDDGGQGLPALPSAPTWVEEPPTYTNVGEYVVWYRITAPNYSNFVHAACVTITNKPVRVMSAEAHQRYPWNGLVDIDVTFDGEASDLALVECTFAATNSATKTALPITYISRAGIDVGSGRDWKRRYVWNAAADVGEIEVSNVVVSVGAKVLGVQLWKDGPYWAECNVGATAPEEYGYYFWWGDTVGYTPEGGKWEDGYNYSDVTWVSSAGTRMGTSPFESSTCPTYGKDNSQLQTLGYIDSEGNLVTARDAATVHLGSPWRMPTDSELSALVSNCTTTLVTTNTGSGYLAYGWRVTGKDNYASKSIFLRIAGFGEGSMLRIPYSGGGCWSSTPTLMSGFNAWNIYYYPYGSFSRTDSYRYCGFNVRPLRDLRSNNGVPTVVELINVTALGFKLSVKNDGLRASTGKETLRYSTLWDGGADETAKVILKQGDTTLAENLTGEGAYNWSVAKPGLYTLTHSTYTNGAVAKTLTAQFNVSGVPVDPAEITVTPYDAPYDGAAHGISVVGPEGTTVKYCATSNGVYDAEATFKDVCMTQVWYEVSGGGYLAYTNSASLKITPRPVTIESGTKTDFVYDGQPHGFSVMIISENGFVVGEGITTSNWATVTAVSEGEVANTFDYAPIAGTTLSNYDISVVTGKIAVVKGTVGPGGGEEPGGGEVPEGGKSKFDVTAMYDGEGHTVNTNRLAEAFKGAMAGAFEIAYARDAAGGGAPALPWGIDPPAFTNVCEETMWYKVTSPNYEDFVHEAKVTVTNRPVTLASQPMSWPYDGEWHSNAVATCVLAYDFVAGETVGTNFTAKIRDVGTVPNAFDLVWDGTAIASNYAVTLVTNNLTVTAVGDTVTVTITGRVNSVVYDGTEKRVSGYDVVAISDPKYAVDDFKFTGVAFTNGTNAGTYPMGLKTGDFVNTNENFTSVVFDVTDGWLKIEKGTVGPGGGEEPGGGEVPECGKSKFDATAMYDGEGHAVDTNRLVAAFGKSMAGAFEIAYARDAAGGGAPALPWGIDPPAFTNVCEETMWYKVTSPNYEDFVHEAKVTITNRPVTLASQPMSWPYDGDWHSNAVATCVSAYDFVVGETVSTNFAGKIRDVGTVPNAFGLVWNGMALASNYAVTLVTNNLTITAAGDTVTVTITGRVNRVTYDGTEKTVGGYDVIAISDPKYTVDDFKFTGKSATNATNAGTYPMGVKTGDFVNTNENFSSVVFDVTDGWLKIEKGSVGPGGGEEPGGGEVPEGGKSKFDVTAIYDGEGHTVDTNRLVAAFKGAMAGAFEIAYARDAAGGGAPALPWGNEPPVFTNVCEEVVWYKVTSPNYEDFVHAAKVTITNRPVTLASQAMSWPYDGEWHSNAVAVCVSDCDFVAGETVSTNFAGKIRDVGSVPNAFDLVWDGTALASNYAVMLVTNDLTVTSVVPGQPFNVTLHYGLDKVVEAEYLSDKGFALPMDWRSDDVVPTGDAWNGFATKRFAGWATTNAYFDAAGDLCQWEANEGRIDYYESFPTNIPTGATGDRAFWARWSYLDSWDAGKTNELGEITSDVQATILEWTGEMVLTGTVDNAEMQDCIRPSDCDWPVLSDDLCAPWYQGFRPYINELTVHANVKRIGAHAFCGCSYLREAFFLGDVPECGMDPFAGCSSAVGYYSKAYEGTWTNRIENGKWMSLAMYCREDVPTFVEKGTYVMMDVQGRAVLTVADGILEVTVASNPKGYAIVAPTGVTVKNAESVPAGRTQVRIAGITVDKSRVVLRLSGLSDGENVVIKGAKALNGPWRPLSMTRKQEDSSQGLVACEIDDAGDCRFFMCE